MRLKRLSHVLLPIVKQQNPEYFQRFSAAVSKPLQFHENVTNLDNCQETEKSLETIHHIYNENKGDNCFVEMLGSSTLSSEQ